MIRILCLTLSLLLYCTALSQARAGDNFETPVTGRILPGWQRADGTRIAALHLALAPGWKTYWRAPGDAGIPPQFDWSGSTNLRGVGITWPAPKVFLTAGMRTIGYTDDLILPIVLAPKQAGKGMKIKATLDIGVCSDICVPHRMTLEAAIDDTNTAPTPAIAAALAAQPYSAKDAGVTSVSCALSPTADGLKIEARVTLPSAGGREVVVIEPGLPGVWMSQTRSTRKGGTLIASGEMVEAGGVPIALDRSKIRITVLGQKHSVDIKGCAPG